MESRLTRIPTIFTTSLFLFILWILLIVSLLQSQISLTYLALFLLVFIYGSKIYSLLSSYGLKQSLVINKRRIFPKSALEIKIELKNNKWLPIRVGLEIPGIEDLVEGETYRESILPSFHEGSITWALHPLKRGVYALGPISLYTLDLVGLYPKEIPWREEAEIIIYPSIYALDFNHRILQQLGNKEAFSLFNDPQNPIGTREYLPNRPAKHINWMATARHRQLQENIFAPSTSNTLLFMVAVEGSRGEDLENLLEEVASLAALLYKEGLGLGLVIDSQLQGKGQNYIPPREGKDQLQLLLETLARATEDVMEDLLELLKRSLLERGATSLFFAKERRLDVEVFLEERGLIPIPIVAKN